MPTTRHQQAFLYPLLPLAIAFGSGVIAASYLAASFPVLCIVTGACCVFAILFLFRRIPRAAVISLILAFLFSGASVASMQSNNVASDRLKHLIESGVVPIGELIEVTGVLEREPEFARQRIYLTLRLEKVRAKQTKTKASGIVKLLAIPKERDGYLLEQLDLRYGARIRAMATVDRTDDYRNPGVSSFTEYLDRKGQDASGIIRSLALVERQDDTPVFLPLAWLYKWRRALQNEIDNRFSAETGGVLDAALLGNRYNLSQTTSDRFREGGTFHVLVISGLHITFLGGLIILFARQFTRNRFLQYLISTIALWGYVMAVGADSSVVRAALMFTVVLPAPLFGRRATSLNALGAAAIVLLVWRPNDLFDPSFQLTFASVLAIVLLAWPLIEKFGAIGSWHPTRETPYPPECPVWLRMPCEALYWSNRKASLDLKRSNYSYHLFKTPVASMLERLRCQRVLRYAFNAVVVSLSVQLTLLPFLVIYFHRVSVASVFLNIAVSALMGIATMLAAIALLLSQLSSVAAAPLIGLTNTLTWLMTHAVDPFARVGMASIRLPEYSGWPASIYALYYVPLFFLIRSLWCWTPLQLQSNGRSNTGRLWLLGSAQLFVTLLIVLHPWSARAQRNVVRVDFLDVGQGDAALITLPNQTNILVDGGGQAGIREKRANGDSATQVEQRRIGEVVVSEYLWSRGLDHVDYLVATHADADHIDGLNDVARNFHVQAAFVARKPEADEEYSEFAETLASAGVPLRQISAGDELRVGDASISVLWPPPTASTTMKSGNNESIVLSLRFGQRSILLTGDIERRAEAALLNSCEGLTADVVKIPHHGSKTSSSPEFVSATSSRYAIASVGLTSIFGHPNAAVVERWNAAGAQVLTTGKSGTITILTDGERLEVQQFVK